MTEKNDDKLTKLQPTCPKNLTGAAKNMYNALVPLLNERGTKRTSQSIVEMYCQTWSINQKAYKQIEYDGFTDPVTGKKSGAMTTYESTTKNLRGLASDLGLTPSSMVQIQKLIVEDDDNDDNETFEERAARAKF